MENFENKVGNKGGPHYVQEAEGLKIGELLNVLSPRATMCTTLTEARRKSRAGFAIIRQKDMKVISVK